MLWLFCILVLFAFPHVYLSLLGAADVGEEGVKVIIQNVESVTDSSSKNNNDNVHDSGAYKSEKQTTKKSVVVGQSAFSLACIKKKGRVSRSRPVHVPMRRQSGHN